MVGVFYFCTMIDYLIVGSGLAGICFADTALRSGKTFLLIDDFSVSSSKVAGGLYNPVILKRFSLVWKAAEQLEYGLQFYEGIEKKLGVTFIHQLPVYRKFVSVEEQNNWFSASDKPKLSPFLSLEIITKKYNGIDSPFGFGEIFRTGYLDMNVFLDSCNQFFSTQQLLLNETFDYSLVETNQEFVQYKDIQAKHLIFAEGFSMHKNPFFKDLPLDGTKGELLIIKAPKLDLDVIINSNLFVLPLGNDLYKIGATYNWSDKTSSPTPEGKAELLIRLMELLTCDFEVVEHLAGVRPTVNDRRPLVGAHPEHKNLYVLNGLGTRGVMLGPWLAKSLFEFIEHDIALDDQINIQRFYKKRGAL